MKKLFDSGELGRAESKKCLKTTEYHLVSPQSLFCPTMPRDSMPANASNSVLAKKSIKELSIFWYFDELNRSVGSNLYQPRKTIRVSEIVKMIPMIRYFLSLTLELAGNHLHISSSNWLEGGHSKGTLIEFLSKITLAQRLSHRDQRFPQYVLL